MRNVKNFICQAVNNKNVYFTSHAKGKMFERGFVSDDVFNCVFTGYICEYNQPLYQLPTCCFVGKTKAGKRLCTVWAYNEVDGYISLITLYPDSYGWAKSHTHKRM